MVGPARARSSRFLEEQPHRVGRGFGAAARARGDSAGAARGAGALASRLRSEGVRVARNVAARGARAAGDARARADPLGRGRLRARAVPRRARRILRRSGSLGAQKAMLRPPRIPEPPALTFWFAPSEIVELRYLYSR